MHCAGYTAVDDAEEEPDRATAVNRDGTRNVALAAAAIGASLVYPSTDYVFDGRSDRPYRPEDETHPVNAYGRSKLASEKVLETTDARWAVVRTSWLYGPDGQDFIDVILGARYRSSPLKIVNDQIGCPDVDGQSGPRVGGAGREGRDRNVPPLRPGQSHLAGPREGGRHPRAPRRRAGGHHQRGLGRARRPAPLLRARLVQGRGPSGPIHAHMGRVSPGASGGDRMNAALYFAPNSVRHSQDLDFFHDSAERVATASAEDSVLLEAAGYSLDLQLSQPGFIRAIVRRDDLATQFDWAHDSAWRFMPPVPDVKRHPDLRSWEIQYVIIHVVTREARFA